MKILIVGAGSIGARHRRVLGGILPDAEFGFVSRRAGSPETVAAELGDVRDLDSYGYVVLASETSRHEEQVRLLAGRCFAGPILLEKPVAMAPFEALPGLDGLRVGYNLRFHPVIARLRELLAGEKWVSVNAIAGQYLPSWRPGRDYRDSYSAKRGEGGGVLLDLSHELDYLAWLFGSMTEVFAYSGKCSDLEIDSDDLLALVGRAASGARIALQLDYLSAAPQRRIIASATGRTIVADLVEGSIRIAGGGEERLERFPPADRDATYRAMHEDVLGGGGTACTLGEGMAVMRTIEGIRISASEGRLHGFGV